MKFIQKITAKEEIAIKTMKVEGDRLIINGKATEDVDLLEIKRKIIENSHVEEVIDHNV